MKIFLFFILFFSCTTKKISIEQEEFFNNLSKLCGNSFNGIATYPDEPMEPFKGATLTMHVNECNKNEIKIPFHVGENTSRTWIISKTKDGLLFKHDHRHNDNTPEEITMYGGLADKNGSMFKQSFPADKHTASLIPEASTNVWALEFSEDFKTFHYILTRHNNMRFQADFNLE